MKTVTRSLLVLILVFVLSFNMSCDILTPLDPELKIEKEAWDVIIEAHALKQLWFHNFFRINSNNYQRGQLFIYEPTAAQVNKLLDDFEELMAYADDVEAAVDSLESLSSSLGKPAVSSSIWGALKSFFGAGKETFANYRKRTVYIASKMTKQERDDMYYDNISSKLQNEIGDADAFWDKFQKGELDDKAQTFYRSCYEDAVYNFGYIAIQNNLTPAHCVSKDGINLCNKGLDVVLETGKMVVPGLGQATDLLDAGKDFVEKTEKMVDKPLEFIADEVKSRAGQKVVGMTSVGELFNADGVGSYVKILAETTLGSDDPQELVENAIDKGIDYGIAKISSSDASVKTDVAIAKNQQPGPGLPEFIIGVGTYAQQANEFLLKLPSGNWGITTRENTGQKSASTTTIVSSQQATTVDVLADTSANSGGSTGSEEDIPPTLAEMFDSLNINIFDKTSIVVLFDPGTDYRYFDIENRAYNHPLAHYAPIWSGYSFSIEFEQTDTVEMIYVGLVLCEESTEINGYFSLDSSYNIVLTLTANNERTYYGNVEGSYLEKQWIQQITTTQLPFSSSRNDLDYFSTENSYLNIEDIADGSYDYYDYSDSGRTVSFEDHVDGFENLSNGRCSVWFDVVDTTYYHVIYDY